MILSKGLYNCGTHWTQSGVQYLPKDLWTGKVAPASYWRISAVYTSIYTVTLSKHNMFVQIISILCTNFNSHKFGHSLACIQINLFLFVKPHLHPPCQFNSPVSTISAYHRAIHVHWEFWHEWQEAKTDLSHNGFPLVCLGKCSVKYRNYLHNSQRQQSCRAFPPYWIVTNILHFNE